MNLLSEYSWCDIECLNEDLCSQNGYQFGQTSDGYEKTKDLFNELQTLEILSLEQTFDGLRALHKSAPFLFLNGVTFNKVASEILQNIDAPRETLSIIGHHIAGVSILSEEELRDILKGLEPTLINKAENLSPYFDQLKKWRDEKLNTETIFENLIPFFEERDMRTAEVSNFKEMLPRYLSGVINDKMMKTFFKSKNVN